MFNDTSFEGLTRMTADLLRMSNDDMEQTIHALCAIAETEEQREDIAKLMFHITMTLGGFAVQAGRDALT